MSTYFFSAPGRTEISGNHTDHQHGCVLAAAVNLETVAEVVLLDDPVIIVHSEGYPAVEVELCDLEVHPEEKNTTQSLVRGVAAAFRQRGANLKGFLAKVRSVCMAAVLPEPCRHLCLRICWIHSRLKWKQYLAPVAAMCYLSGMRAAFV